MVVFFKRFCLISLVVLLMVPTSSLAQLSESELSPMGTISPFQLGRPNTMGKPIKIDRKRKPTLADVFPHRELSVIPLQPISLSGVKIPGLSEEQVYNLGVNYFCVINNTDVDSFSKLYKWNRLQGKSSFITVDCLMHPYFGFKNALMGAVIEKYLYADMGHLLRATIAASIADFRLAEDEEVKDDIQRNLAYLSVGLKLLEPDSKLPDIGGVDELVNEDYKKVLAGKRAISHIFNQQIDFSDCRPWGWYQNSSKVRRFFRSYQWLSRVYFPLKNVSINTKSGGGNKFRRAVLLYRALTLGRVYGKPALTYWGRIGNAFALCGMDNYYRIHTILPTDLTSVLSRSRGDFDKLLKIVSHPYARTKLMLSIRKQRPVNLGSTSILEIGSNAKKEEDLEVIRFLPLIQPAELSWLKHVGHEYKTETEAPTPTPLSLLTMHGHGAVQATNLLSMQLETLDSRLLTAVPRLERIISLSKGGRGQIETDKRWKLVSMMFRPYSEKSQAVLRSGLWQSRQLESAMGAWIDSFNAYTPVKMARAKESQSSSSGNTANSASKSRPSNFHYLEPRPLMYQIMEDDLNVTKNTLNKLEIFPEEYASRLDDFQRLYGRLALIAKREVEGMPIMRSDFSLLSNIDLLLNPVDSSLPSSIFFNLGQKKKAEGGEGASIGIGNAGYLYMVCSTTQGATLCRGGVYTLFELAGGPFAKRHWDRKLKYDLLRPPIWARLFDYYRKKDTTRSN